MSTNVWQMPNGRPMLRHRNRLDLETESSLLAEVQNKAPAALLRRREEGAKREPRGAT
jgi:hypothetical protein